VFAVAMIRRMSHERTTDRHARVAALYDVHGNLPALEAVLADVDALVVDTIVVGGDVASGPMRRALLPWRTR